jgi:hypothetical protein
MRKNLLAAVAALSFVPAALSAQSEETPPATRGPWDSMEYLLWWNKDIRLPPILTKARSGVPPVLGGASTTNVIGGSPLDTPDQSGGRFTVGWSADPSDTFGFEVNYFFIGSRTTTFAGGGGNAPASPALGFPYIDARTGSEAVVPIAGPGFGPGGLVVAASSRLQGTELNGVMALWSWSGLELHGLLGFRYLEVDEGLQIQRISDCLCDPATFGLTHLSSADQIDGHNRFYGGQVGLKALFGYGPVFVEGIGKLGAGAVEKVVRIDGLTRFEGPALTDWRQAGGLVALASNSGRHRRDVFGLVPELTLRAGLNFDGRTKLFVGYNLLYLTEVARPGEQIDRVINPGQFPVNAGRSSLDGPDRPVFGFSRSEFWTQGLIVGMEWRY